MYKFISNKQLEEHGLAYNYKPIELLQPYLPDDATIEQFHQYGLTDDQIRDITDDIIKRLSDKEFINEYLEKISSPNITEEMIDYIRSDNIPLYYFKHILEIDALVYVLCNKHTQGDNLIHALDMFNKVINADFVYLVYVGLHFGFKELISKVIRDPHIKTIYPSTENYELFTVEYINDTYCKNGIFDINAKWICDELSHALHFGFGYSIARMGHEDDDRLKTAKLPNMIIRVDHLDDSWEPGENDKIVISI